MTVSSFEGSKTFKRQSMGHVAQFRINDRLLGSEFALFTLFSIPQTFFASYT